MWDSSANEAEVIGLTRLPHYTVLWTWFARIPTKVWRAFLYASVKTREGNAAIDAWLVTIKA
ncbi:hypothetical protein GCM10022627_02130 [Haloarcula argentinensis]